MMKEAAKARKKTSRVCFQNRRKNTPATSELVAITPIRNPSIMGSLAFPDQSVQQKGHGDRRGDEAPAVQIYLRDDDKVQEHQEIRDREPGKTQAAPQQESLLGTNVAAQQKERAEQRRDDTEQVDRLSHLTHAPLLCGKPWRIREQRWKPWNESWWKCGRVRGGRWHPLRRSDDLFRASRRRSGRVRWNPEPSQSGGGDGGPAKAGERYRDSRTSA